MIEQAFEVATEFRFDIGSALINTKALTDSVDNLSTAATSAQNQLNYLAGGLVAHLGLGSGGLISVLRHAVDVSEEFQNGMFGFVNSIDSNMQVLTGTINTFNDRLATSKMLMNNVNAEADKFGLSGRELAQVTNLVASPLAARGRLGKNYGNAISMARNMMLTSEAVGLPQAMGAEMLVRGLTSGMLGGKLFERLANTQAFRQQRIFRPEQLGPMRMNDSRRIDLLARALEQLGGNAELLAFRIGTITFQFARLKTRLDQIFRPIGDAVKAPIIILFQKLNEWLKMYGPQLGQALATLVTQFTKNPEALIVGLMQLSHLKHDLANAFKFAGFFQLLSFAIPILRSLGLMNGQLIYGVFFALGRGISYIMMFLGSSFFGKILHLAAVGLASFLPQFLIFAAVFTTLSRASAKAKIYDAKNLATHSNEFATVFARLWRAINIIFRPITKIIDVIADLISPLFRVSTYANFALKALTMLADSLDNVANDVIILSGLFIAFNDAMTESTKLKNIAQGPEHMKEVWGDTFLKSYDIFSKHHPFLSSQNAPIAKTEVTNNNHIEARFDMREQLEPDRIAFAVTTHLKKLALNAVQSRGNSISTGFSGNQLSRGVTE